MKKRLLFVGTGNSARSQMAEALFRDLGGDQWTVHSAGSNPEEVDPRTIKILTDVDLLTGAIRSKSLDEVAGQSFDYVISLCSEAAKECASLEFGGRRIACGNAPAS